MLAYSVTGGCSGIFPRNSGEGTVFRGVDLVQDLVRRIDDVCPEGCVLCEGELHSGELLAVSVQEGASMPGVDIEFIYPCAHHQLPKRFKSHLRIPGGSHPRAVGCESPQRIQQLHLNLSPSIGSSCVPLDTLGFEEA